EWKFGLSKKTVPTGTIVIFKITNKGKIGHDFKINGKKTPLIQPGKTATLKVVFKKKGRLTYICTVKGHAARGMKGSFAVCLKPGGTETWAVNLTTGTKQVICDVPFHVDRGMTTTLTVS